MKNYIFIYIYIYIIYIDKYLSSQSTIKSMQINKTISFKFYQSPKNYLNNKMFLKMFRGSPKGNQYRTSLLCKLGTKKI